MSTSMRPAIEFVGVSKRYVTYDAAGAGLKRFLFNLRHSLAAMRNPGYTALSNVSFSISEGETVGLIGRNGAGKSTILGLIAGVLKPSQGKVVVNGRVSPMLELGSGFHPDLSGRENIMLNGVLLGMTRQQVIENMESIIEFSDLREFIDQPVRTYSSGMLAKLGFSIVSKSNPEVLIVDEVLAVGDLQFQKKCMNVIRDFRQRGVTIFFVSHSLEQVAEVCDRVLWVENHSIKMDGRPQEITSAYYMANSGQPMPASATGILRKQSI